jgi:hypothetical protein
MKHIQMQLSNDDSENIWILRDACRFNRSKMSHHNSGGPNTDYSTNCISKGKLVENGDF